MKEQFTSYNLRDRQVYASRLTGLTDVWQKPYAENTPNFMQDLDIDTEGQSTSGAENRHQEERQRIKAEAAKSHLDSLVKEISERVAKSEKKELNAGKLHGEYSRLTDAINTASDVIPKSYRKEAIKPAKKLQRHIRNLLLVQRSQEKFEAKVKEAEKKGLKVEMPKGGQDTFISRWKRRFTGEEYGDAEIKEAIEKQAKRGIGPEDEDDEEVKARRERVLKNSKLSDEDRYKKAVEVLEEYYEEKGINKKIAPEREEELKAAILAAHKVGEGEVGIDGKPASVFNYNPEQIRRKIEALRGDRNKAEILTIDERRLLIEEGIAGNSPMDASGGPGPGSEASDRPSNYGENESTNRAQGEVNRSPGEVEAILGQWRLHHRMQYGKDPTFAEMQAYKGMSEIGLSPLGGEGTQQYSGLVDHTGSAPLQQEKNQGVSDQTISRERDEGDPSGIKPPEKMVELERYLVESKVEETREHLTEGGIDQDMYGRKVNSIEVLAYEIMENEKDPKYQIDQPLGLLKYRRLPNGEIDYTTVEKVVKGRDGKEYIEVRKEPKVDFQEANFMHWVREWMMYWHSESPDQEWNFGEKIGLKRDYGSISLDQMINNPGRYFRSWTKTQSKDKDKKLEFNKDGTPKMENAVNLELVNQIKKELWLFGSSRTADIKYRLIMGEDEKLPQAIQELFYLNTFTKTVWDNRSGLYHMMSLPEYFKDMDGDVKGDTRLGQALNSAYQVYYNIADREMLEELLGKDAPLLSGKEILEKLKDMARREGFEDWADNPYDPKVETFIKPDLIENLLDPKKGPNEVLKFINIFDTQGTPDRQVAAVRELIRDSINKKLRVEGSDEFDEVNLRYAEQFALSMARWTGAAARNDWDATGYDAWTRIQVTEEYRRKQLERKRGGAFGNPYTVNDLKQVGVDLFNGIQVQSMKDQDGSPRAKSVLEVLDEMQKAKDSDAYHKAAAQLVFSENTMRGFANDHMNRSFTVFRQVQGSEEINFEKFTHFDYIRGVTFDRAAFEEELKEKFFKPMRYGYSTYPQIDFGKIVRSDVSKGQDAPQFKDMHLGEAMFGKEIIDGAMWEDKHGHQHHFYLKGKEHISMKDDNWSEKIDWEKVSSSEGRIAIWRQVAIARLSSQLYAHKDFHSTDPAYNWWYYNEIIEALEAIPGRIIGDDTDLKSSRAVDTFFTHHDIEWLRENSHTERWRLYRTAILNDVFKGSTKGFKDALKKFFEGIAKS